MSKNTLLIGIDPGLASCGWGVISIAPGCDVMRCDGLGVHETKKATKKQHVLATEDNLRRARELTAFLQRLFKTHAGDERNRVVAICAESMSWPRNAGASAKIGIAWGVIASCAFTWGIPILQASPQTVKKALTGRRDATKEEVEDAVIQRVPRANEATTSAKLLVGAASHIPKTKREHPFDALAVAITCSSAEPVAIARRALQ